MITEVNQNNIVPYIPNKCAALRLPTPNSEVVNISLPTVLIITEVFSPVVSVFFADFFAFFAFSKKY